MAENGRRHAGGGLVVLGCGLGLVVQSLGSGQEFEQLETLEGRRVESQVCEIDAYGGLRLEPAIQGVDRLSDVRAIYRSARAAEAFEPVAALLQPGGGGLLVGSFVLSGQGVKWTWAWGEQVDLPVKVFSGVLLGSKGLATGSPEHAAGRGAPSLWRDLAPDFLAALAEPDVSSDRLFVRADSGLESVSGVLEQITEQYVIFRWQNESRHVGRERVYGVVLGGSHLMQKPRARLELVDGSVVLGEIRQLREGRLEIAIEGSSLYLPWGVVRSIRLASDRLVFLSDLQPVEVFEDHFPVHGFSWQADRDFRGRTLRLGEQHFDKGLVMHATCRLTYALDGQFETFATTVGLNPPAPELADCILRVLADDRVVWEERRCGTGPPRPLVIPVRGVRRLTLAVEAGENLSLADHVIWAEARLILPAR